MKADAGSRIGDGRAPTRRAILQAGTIGAAAGIAAPWLGGAAGAEPGRVFHEMNGRGTQTMVTGAWDAERLARMHEAMARHVASGRLPGLVTLISRRGDTIVDPIGQTAFDDGTPMQRDTIFRLASVTKPMTAAAAMILVEECVLRLDDPVDPLLPELADRRVLHRIDGPLDDTVPANRPITLRDLLTLRLGYGAIFTPPDRSPLAQALIEAGVAAGATLPALAPDDYMRAFQNIPLAHQPGEQWLYNTGSDMLGVLIARASGMSLGAFLQERLFAPLGMKDTGFSVPAAKIDRLAASYGINFETGEFGIFDPSEGSHWASPPIFESGAGGLVSTVDDLLAFGEMMLNDGTYGDERILSRPSVALMSTDQLTPAQKAASTSDFFPGFFDSYGWGFGVAINTRRDDLAATPGRYGWDGGYGTSWYVDPAEELIGVLMTQRLWDEPGYPTALRDFWTATYQAIAG